MMGTHVETREDGVERRRTIGVCRPHATQPGAVVGDKRLVENGQSVTYSPMSAFSDL